VAGFQLGAKHPVLGFSQPERRLKPVPHKNVGGSGVDHGLNITRDAHTPGRFQNGTAKNPARWTRGTARMTSSRKRDLLPNDHRKCLITFGIVL
jgi:hypothetical protein